MDISRLIVQLNNTGLQNKDNQLYQLIFQLINQLSSLGSDLSGIQNIISNTITNNINISNFLISGSGGSDSGGGDIIPGPRGRKGDTGATGPRAFSLFLEDTIYNDSPIVQGRRGIQGPTGATGPRAYSLFIENDYQAEFLPIPGPRGASGSSGTNGLTLLEEHTASGSSSLVFTTWYSSTYDEYIIEIVNLVNGSSAIPRIRVSTDGGATYDSGINYDWGWQFNYSGGNGSIFGAAATSIQWRDTNTPLNANGSWDGSLRLFNPGGALYKSFIGQIAVRDNIAGIIFFHGGGQYLSTTAINAFEITMSTGTFNGTVRVYGLAK